MELCPSCFARLADPTVAYCAACGRPLAPTARPGSAPPARPLGAGPDPPSGAVFSRPDGGAYEPPAEPPVLPSPALDPTGGFTDAGPSSTPRAAGRRRAAWTLFAALGAAVAVVVVAVVAVVAGGSSGDGGVASVVPSTDRTSVPSTDAATNRGAVAATTRAAVAATTRAAGELGAATTNVGGPLLAGADGIELVVLSGDTLLRVDLATGVRTVVADDVPLVQNPLTRSLVLGDHVLIATSGSLHTVSLTDGTVSMEDTGSSTDDDSVCAWAPGDQPARIWALPCGGGTRAVEYSVVDHKETARRVFPSRVEAVSGRVPGVGFAVQAGGGVYLVADDGTTTRLGTGRVLAAAGRYLALRRCDAAMTCASSVLDLTTGDQRPLAVADGLAAGDREGFLPSVPAPSGDRSLIFMFDRGPVAAVFDGPAGTIELVPADAEVQDPSNVAWSADGSWLFVDVTVGLWAWHVGDEDPVPIPGLPGVQLLGARG